MFANHAAHLIVVNVSWEGISRYLHMEELADIGHSVRDSPQFLYWCRYWMGVQPTEGLLFLCCWRLKGKVFLWVRRSHYQGHGQPQNGTKVPQPDLSHVSVCRHGTSLHGCAHLQPSARTHFVIYRFRVFHNSVGKYIKYIYKIYKLTGKRRARRSGEFLLDFLKVRKPTIVRLAPVIDR